MEEHATNRTGRTSRVCVHSTSAAGSVNSVSDVTTRTVTQICEMSSPNACQTGTNIYDDGIHHNYQVLPGNYEDMHAQTTTFRRDVEIGINYLSFSC